MTTVLVRCGDGVLVDDGTRWVFGRQPGARGNVAAFVFALVGLILAGNGVVQLVIGELIAFGIAASVFGVLILCVAVGLVRARDRQRVAAPLQPLLQLDFASGLLLDAAGRPLAPMAEVVFSAAMRLTSSARALHCRWPGGDMVVLRGDAFGGGIAPAIDALRSRGLRA
jgi:hypothetical protein